MSGKNGKHPTLERSILRATWDISMLRVDLEEKARVSPAENKAFQYFAENIYPPLAACTDPMPTLEEAFAMPPAEWDQWYLLAREKNPSWFDDSPLTEEAVEFSDGRIITVQSMRPSTLMKRETLDAEAEAGEPLENTRREVFRSIYYPKLAGCSIGNVPEEADARSIMGMEDLQLWYDAAKRQCPSWFVTLEELAAQNQAGSKEKKSSE